MAEKVPPPERGSTADEAALEVLERLERKVAIAEGVDKLKASGAARKAAEVERQEAEVRTEARKQLIRDRLNEINKTWGRTVSQVNPDIEVEKLETELKGFETPAAVSGSSDIRKEQKAELEAAVAALDQQTKISRKERKQRKYVMGRTNEAIEVMALEAEQERLEAAKTAAAHPASAVYAPPHAVETEDSSEVKGDTPPVELPGASDAEAAAAVYAPAHGIDAAEPPPPPPPAPPAESAPAAARPADLEEAAAIYQHAYNHPKYPKGAETPGAPEGGPNPVPGAPEAGSAAEVGPKSLKEQALEKQAELRELMLKTRGPEEVAKLEAIFGKQLRTSPEFFLKSAPMAERMLNAEQAYLAAYRQWNGDRHDLGVMSEQVWMGAGDNVPPRVKELREKWVQERAAYNGYLRSSAEVRYQDRRKSEEERSKMFTERKGEKNFPFTRERVLERYNRIVAVRETVLGAEEAELRAKEMGLSERKRGALGKLFDGYKKLPLWQRVLASSAILAGAGAATVLMGSGLGWIPLIMAGPSALLTWRAAAAKTPGTRTALGYAASVTGIAGVFGLVGEGLARGLHGLFGTRKKAAAKLAQRAGFADLSTEAGMKEASKQRKKAGRAGERIARDARLSRTGAALIGGYEAGHALRGSGLFDGHAHDTGPGNHDAPPNTNPGNEGPSTAEFKDQDLSVGDIDDGVKISNADKLFGHFTENLLPDYPEGAAPPAIAKLYQLMGGVHDGKLDLLHGEDPLSKALGFETGDGKWSTVMHNGDTSRFHEGAIQFHHEGDAPDHWRTVIDAEGGVHPEAVADLPKMDAAGNIIGGTTTPEVPSATTPEVATTQGSDVSIASGTEIPEQNGVTVASGMEPKTEGGVTITPGSSVTEGAHEHGATAAPADTTPKPAEAAPAPTSDEVPPPPPPPPAEAAIANPLNVDPHVVAPYFAKGPGGVEQLWMIGGSFEDRFRAAQEFAFSHPGTTIRFDATLPDGTPAVSAFSSDAAGRMLKTPSFLESAPGIKEQPIGLDQLTRVAP